MWILEVTPRLRLFKKQPAKKVTPRLRLKVAKMTEKVTPRLRYFEESVTSKKIIKTTSYFKKVTGYAYFKLIRKKKNISNIHVYRVWGGVTPILAKPFGAKAPSPEGCSRISNTLGGVTLAKPPCKTKSPEAPKTEGYGLILGVFSGRNLGIFQENPTRAAS